VTADPLDNAALADRLEAFAALLDLEGARPFNARAYRRAADVVRAAPTPVADLVRSGRARDLRGIGPGIDARLRELVETGEIAELAELERRTSPELVGLARLVGLAPERLVAVGDALGVRTAAELRAAAEEGALRRVPGIGPATEAKVLERLRSGDAPRARHGLLLNRAWAISSAIADALGGVVAGDPRRWRDLSERLAVVVAAERPSPVLDGFAAHPQVVSVLEREEQRAVGLTVDGVPIEVVVSPSATFGTALVRATGAAAWVEAFEPLPEAPTEEELFARLGRPFVSPELRERDAPDVAADVLVRLDDVRGDLHCHTTWSDGRATVLELATAARDLGYEYVAVCDHTPAVRVVPGLDADAVRRQGEEIAAANEELAPFRVLRGIECDILADGSLDLPDDVLAELDWVQISVHAGQRTERRELTRRVVEAMRHPAACCLSHPKGRMLNRRPENALDLDETFAVALATGVAVEVNGLADRLDLRDAHVAHAVAAGVPIVCSTDAHSARGLGNMALSVATARRGGAAAGDVLNTLPLAELQSRSQR
jgi:DNA polymerase (family 10)